MTEHALLQRITVRPEIFSGKPIIRDMRISVELILSLLAQGVTPEALLADYPDLTVEDIRACLAYAHAVIAGDTDHHHGTSWADPHLTATHMRPSPTTGEVYER
jgi:uncharacterized protein (DUF433 family)